MKISIYHVHGSLLSLPTTPVRFSFLASLFTGYTETQAPYVESSP